MTVTVTIKNHLGNPETARYSRPSLLGEYSEVLPGQEVDVTVYRNNPLLISVAPAEERLVVPAVRIGYSWKKAGYITRDPQEMIRPGFGPQGEGFSLLHLDKHEYCIANYSIEGGWVLVGRPPNCGWKCVVLNSNQYEHNKETDTNSSRGLIALQTGGPGMWMGYLVDDVWVTEPFSRY